MCLSGDSSVSQVTCHRSRDVSSQVLLPPQRPSTLPSSPRRPLSTAPPIQRPSPASPRSPQQEAVTLTTPRKSSSTVVVPRTYMSPTASSMAKMSRSVSVGDGLNETSEDPAVTSSIVSSAVATTSSEIKESLPLQVAVVSSNAVLTTPPHAAVIPVVVLGVPMSSSLGNMGHQAVPPPRSLQARVHGRPLPDKPSLASFSPSTKDPSNPAPSPLSRPPPVSVSPLIPPRQEEPQILAGGGGGSVEQREDAGLDTSSPPLLHPFILSSLRLGSGAWLRPPPSSLHSSSSLLSLGETVTPSPSLFTFLLVFIFPAVFAVLRTEGRGVRVGF